MGPLMRRSPSLSHVGGWPARVYPRLGREGRRIYADEECDLMPRRLHHASRCKCLPSLWGL
jgi:hypothetical protein